MPSESRRPPDQDARDRIVHDLERCLLVEAAAGTGKTTSMVARMVALLAEGKCEVSQIAAITFTRKAAAELRDRFQIALFESTRSTEGKEQTLLSEAAAQIDRGFIGTIHSFCARLLHERPVEAGVDISFQELDDAEDHRLRKKAWDEHVAELFADDHPVLEDLHRLGLSLGQLSSAFLKVADYPDVSDWPATPVEPPELIPIVREVRTYANHMTKVAEDFIDDSVTDEMAEEYKLIPKLIHVLDLEDPVDVMRLLRRFKKSMKPVQKNWIPLTGGSYDRPRIKEEEERWKRFAEDIAEPAIQRWREFCYPTVLDAIRTALLRYDELRRTTGRLNYQDLLIKAAALFRDHPQVRRYFARRFTHLLVDEFQDTDPVQAEVMLLLTSEETETKEWMRCRPVPGSLFVVGDPKQSIYRFRRADIVTYNQVKNIIQNTGGEVVTLSTNFRTLEPITSWVNEVFEDPFNDASEKHSPRYVALQAGRSESETGGWPTVSKITVSAEGGKDSDLVQADAERIARTIRHAIDTGLRLPRTPAEAERDVSPAAQPGDFLILTWRKKHLSSYARKLQEYGIPHLVTGGGGVGEVEEVRLLRNCLSVLARPDNPVALVGLLRGPLFGIDDETLFRFRDSGGGFDFRKRIADTVDPEAAAPIASVFKQLGKYRSWFEFLPVSTTIERVIDDLGLLVRSLTGEEGNLAAGGFLKAVEYLRSNRTSIATFGDLLDVLDNLLEGEESLDGIPAYADPGSVVRIMNLHKAKGLEAPVVFLADPTGRRKHRPDIHIERQPGGSKGYLLVQETIENAFYRLNLAQPLDWTVWEEEEQRFFDAEEKRLLYVATTRAGSHLVVSQKEGKKESGPWGFFGGALENCPDLPEPSAPPLPTVQAEPLTFETFESFQALNKERWSKIQEFSHDAEAAKQVETNLLSYHSTHGDRGTDWGTLIHVLLETVMQDPQVNLDSLARVTLEEMELDPDWEEPALEVVTKVRGSKIWKRALASSRRFVEIPFQILKDDTQGTKPVLIRGVIDLAFREPQGWILVDYKTDRISENELDLIQKKYRQQLINYGNAWRGITHEPVIEKVIYLTALDTEVSMLE